MSAQPRSCRSGRVPDVAAQPSEWARGRMSCAPASLDLMRGRALLPAALLLCCCSCLSFRPDVALDADASQAARGFKPEGERRMIYTYVGRIYATVGDYPRAIQSFQQKLDAYPKHVKSSQRDLVSSEKSVILNQMGTYAFRLGKYESALRYYRESLRLASEVKVVHGEVVNSANIGQVVLRMLTAAPADAAQPAGAGRLLKEAYRAQAQALKRIDDSPEYRHPEYRLYLRSSMAGLAHRAAALGVILPLSSPTEEGSKG